MFCSVSAFRPFPMYAPAWLVTLLYMYMADNTLTIVPTYC